jgi:hypothetical protein
LTPAAARQARRVAKAGRFYASQFLDKQDHDNPIPLGAGLGDQYMHLKVRPCTLADIRFEFKAYETWTVKEDGSARELEATDFDHISEEFWICRNCQLLSWCWLEMEKHVAEQAEATLVPA